MIGAFVLHLECSVRRSARLRGLDSRQPTKGEHMAEQVRADLGYSVWLAGWTHIGISTLGRWWMARAACWDPISSGRIPPPMSQLVAWMESRGRICRVGVGGTGSYGAGLTRSHRGGYRCGGGEPSQPSATPAAGQGVNHRR